jgi:hypothetical protein
MIRMLWLIRYPEEITVEEGDRWYLGTHVQEVKQSPAFARYLTWTPLDIPAFGETVPGPDGVPVVRAPSSANSPKWHRVTEMAFRDFNTWATRHQGMAPFTPAPWGRGFISERVVISDKPELDILAEEPPSFG